MRRRHRGLLFLALVILILVAGQFLSYYIEHGTLGFVITMIVLLVAELSFGLSQIYRRKRRRDARKL